MGRSQCELIESIDYSIPPCYPSDEELEKIKKHIVKHSPNIIDLIEAGDYVNGEPVEEIVIATDEFEITTTTEYLTNVEDIKSIVTKEQFASMEYRLEV